MLNGKRILALTVGMFAGRTLYAPRRIPVIRLMSQLIAKVQDAEQIIEVKENKNEQSMKFPVVWLRDNCLCDKCFHQSSQSRTPKHWENLNADVKIKKIETSDAAQHVNIEWTDNHMSTFDLNWLKERNFSSKTQEKYIREWYRPEHILWGPSDFKKILKTLEYKDVMEKDEVLLEWLEALAVYGVCMLKNSPIEQGIINKLADRIGFIRQTTYGVIFNVRSEVNPKNYAFQSEALPLHTDLTYYEYKPGVAILHTLEQSKSEGGHNILTDTFNVAEQIRKSHPEYFRTLSETRVDWSDVYMLNGVAFHNILRAPLINMDADGKYTRTNYNEQQRDSHFTIDIEKVKTWYAAHALFVRMVNEQVATFKTVPGDVLTFNNLRLIHGRTGYKDSDHNVRHIIGGFVDWDLAFSKMRVLKKSLADQRNDCTQEK